MKSGCPDGSLPHHSTTKVRLVTPFDLCTSLIFMMFGNPGKWENGGGKFAAQKRGM